jgi:hypothetical protein
MDIMTLGILVHVRGILLPPITVNSIQPITLTVKGSKVVKKLPNFDVESSMRSTVSKINHVLLTLKYCICPVSAMDSYHKGKGKGVFMLNQAPCYSGGIAPHILNLGASWK